MDPESPQSVPGTPGSAGPGSPDDLGWFPRVVTADWVDEQEWARMCAVLGEDEEPPDPVSALYDDPDSGLRPEWEQESWEVLTARAEAEGAEYQDLIARMAAAGYSESAHVRGDPPVPGSPEGPAAGFGQGRPLDTAAPSTVMSGLADEASGEDRSFQDVTDDQLMGLIGARARLVSRQQWELLTAIAEFIRRRPHPDADLAAQLHVTGTMAGALLGLAHDLMVKLPLTRAALRDGVIDLDKARTIVVQCWPLTPEQAREAERILFGLDTVEDMTWGMIRDRMSRAVKEIDPEAARKRRKDAERHKRVEVFPECCQAGPHLHQQTHPIPRLSEPEQRQDRDTPGLADGTRLGPGHGRDQPPPARDPGRQPRGPSAVRGRYKHGDLPVRPRRASDQRAQQHRAACHPNRLG